MFKSHPRRMSLGFSLMASRAFVNNAALVAYALVLPTFYEVLSGRSRVDRAGTGRHRAAGR
jgi:hypothetical protein